MSGTIETLSGARILVTGGAGFIGSQVSHQLSELGARTIIVDNLVNGKRENVEEILGDRVSLEVADIRDLDLMGRLLSKVDMVLHLACLGVRHSIHSPFENHDVNATATLNLLELSRQQGIDRFVYVSSSEIYGTARTTPMTEQHPAWPHTVYGSGKLAGERYTDAYYKTYDMPTVVVRPFNAFGPHSHHEGDSGEVIPKFMLRSMKGMPLIVHGDGSQTRDFTFVSDTARAILLATVKQEALGQTINFGQGKEISINELAAEICEVTGQQGTPVIHSEGRPGDVLRLYCDNSLAERLLGYVPEVSLHEGLQQLYRWYTDSGRSIEELICGEVKNNWTKAD